MKNFSTTVSIGGVPVCSNGAAQGVSLCWSSFATMFRTGCKWQLRGLYICVLGSLALSSCRLERTETRVARAAYDELHFVLSDRILSASEATDDGSVDGQLSILELKLMLKDRGFSEAYVHTDALTPRGIDLTFQSALAVRFSDGKVRRFPNPPEGKHGLKTLDLGNYISMTE